MAAPSNGNELDGDELIRSLLKGLTGVIAWFIGNSCATLPYERLEKALFIGLDDALAALGIPLDTIAALLQVHRRTVLHRRQQARADQHPHKVAEPHEGLPLAATILQHLQQHPSGATWRQLQEHFQTQKDERRQRRLWGSLHRLLRYELVGQTGAGATTRYLALSADFLANNAKSYGPDFLLALQEHLTTAMQALVTACQNTLYNQEARAVLHTFRVRVRRESGKATEILKRVADFVQEMEAACEASEAEHAPPGEGWIELYVGEVLHAPRDEIVKP